MAALPFPTVQGRVQSRDAETTPTHFLSCVLTGGESEGCSAPLFPILLSFPLGFLASNAGGGGGCQEEVGRGGCQEEVRW